MLLDWCVQNGRLHLFRGGGDGESVEFPYSFCVLMGLVKPLSLEMERLIAQKVLARQVTTVAGGKGVLGIKLAFESKELAVSALGRASEIVETVSRLGIGGGRWEIAESNLNESDHFPIQLPPALRVVAVSLKPHLPPSVVDAENKEVVWRSGLRRFVRFLATLDPDCVVVDTQQEMIEFAARCLAEGVEFNLSRTPAASCTSSSNAFRIPGRLVVDLASFAELLGKPRLSPSGSTAWERYSAFNQLGGVPALQRVTRGYRFADVVDFGFPATIVSTPPPPTPRIAEEQPRKRQRASNQYAAAAQLLSLSPNASLALVAHPPRNDLPRFALECNAVGSKCLAKLNQLLVELGAAPAACSLLRPAYLQLQAAQLNNGSNHLAHCLTQTTQGSFLTTLVQTRFVQWINMIEFHPEMELVLPHVSDGDLKRLFQRAQPGRIHPLVLQRCRDDWLDTKHARDVLASTFDYLVQSSLVEASRVFQQLRLRGGGDVFEATCPRRLQGKLGEWRTVGERIARDKLPRVVPPVVLKDFGFLLWSKALVGGSELASANTICFAIGCLFPRPLLPASPMASQEERKQEEIITATFLTALVTCVFDSRFHNDLVTWAYLVKYTYTSPSISALLRQETQAQLGEVVRVYPHNLLLAVAMHLFHTSRGSTAAIRQDLYELSQANALEIGCVLVAGLGKSNNNNELLTKEEERLVLGHFHKQPNCQQCGMELDLLLQVHAVSANQSHLPLRMLAEQLEKNAPMTPSKIQHLGRQLCRTLLASDQPAVAGSKLKLLGALCFREGGKQAILDTLHWPGFLAQFLSHPQDSVRQNSFCLLHEICTTIQSSGSSGGMPKSCFVVKREDAMLFQIEQDHKLCCAVLTLLAQQQQPQAVIWSLALPTCSALMELHQQSKSTGQGKVEIAQGVIQLLLGEVASGSHQAEVSNLVAMGIKTTPLLHLLKQLPAHDKQRLQQKLVLDAHTAERIRLALFPPSSDMYK
ncbi:hypothetical protein BASA81_001185 [Batrachochytrium salamandrivorans]|nr:hypothetical protein BASA81_001185 [Batrachochytrium salamandrivorans]